MIFSGNSSVTDNAEYSEMSVVKSCENSVVFASLPLAIKWLRDTAKHNKSVRLKVIRPFFFFSFLNKKKID